MIEEIHEHTYGFSSYQGNRGTPPVYDPNEKRITETNPQTLANLLVIFEEHDFTEDLKNDLHRNQATREFVMNGKLSPSKKEELIRDRNIALGIAAGYLNLTAALMGYRTGCCQCGDFDKIREIALQHPQVLGFHDLRTRDTGRKYIIQFHLELDPKMSLLESHKITDEVTDNVLDVYPDSELIIHTDPLGIDEARDPFE